MEKHLLLTFLLALLCSCGSSNSASFWIANNSNTSVELQSTVISPTSLGGPKVISKPLLAKPGDIIELGAASFDKNGPITDLFNYKIAGNNGSLKDPMDINNWQKITDKKGKIKYVLYLVSN
ncbi:hypothetical protein [Spongiivirga citrea]|uniref:Uncharacterized protein n=1 Tax=Spongiivirga citrea TaxID=1481457 RepID=A0A6M0CPH3_9FLAO|nr:hypothetical protein [Spongiivirga citrea]NER17934.1 hypothetical protein [Spongiivirga citrea]